MVVCGERKDPTSWDLMICRVQPLLLFHLHLHTNKAQTQGMKSKLKGLQHQKRDHVVY